MSGFDIGVPELVGKQSAKAWGENEIHRALEPPIYNCKAVFIHVLSAHKIGRDSGPMIVTWASIGRANRWINMPSFPTAKFLLGIIALMSGVVCSFAQDASPGAIVAREPGGPTITTIALRLNGENSATAILLYVKPTKADLANVRFFVQLTDANGQPVADPTFSFQVNGTEIPETGVTFPARKQVPVTLKISNVSGAGKFGGALFIDQKGERSRLIGLSLERYPLPVLKVSGAADPGGIKLTTGNTAWQHRFRIESMNVAPVEMLKVLVGPLTGPNGAQVETDWKIDGKPGLQTCLAVPGLGVVEGEVSGKLPLTGVYSGTVTLIYANRRESIPLLITRARPQLAVEVLGVDTGRGTACGSGTFWLTLQGTSGQPVTLDLPTITVLARRGPNQSKLQAQFRSVQVTGEDGTPVQGPLVLEPGAPKRLRVIIHDLTEPGEYVGAVRVAAPDMQPIDQPVTLLMKSSIWIAIGLICIGVLGSHLLRTWVKFVRPRLVRQQRVQVLLGDLERLAQEPSAKPATPQEVLAALRARLDSLDEQLALGNDRNAEATLEEVNQKLTLFPRWAEGLGRVEALQPVTLRPLFRDRLNQIDAFLRGDGLQNLAEHRAYLDGLRNEIAQAVRNDLTTKIGDFRTDLQQQLHVAHLPRARYAVVQQQLAEAEARLQTDQPDAALAPYRRARGAYVALLAVELETGLAAFDKPPTLTDPEWNDFLNAVRGETQLALDAADADPDSAFVHYQAAYTLYLTTLARSMQRDIDDRLAAAQGLANFTAQMRDQFLALKERLNPVVQEAEAKHYRQAAQQYAQVKNELLNLIGSIAKEGVQMGGGAAASGVPDAASGGQAPAATASEGTPETAVVREPRARLTVDWLKQLVLTGDTLVLLGIAVIAVLLGLKLLYLDDPTWGGGNAYLIAILWGLGLHQVSGTTFEGLVGLKEKLFG